MMPGQDRQVDAAGADPLDQREVVGRPEEHLGDGELRAGPGLRDQHVGVVVERLGRRVTLREGRHPDPEVAADAGQRRPARWRRSARRRSGVQAARGPSLGSPRSAMHVVDPGGGVRVEDALELLRGCGRRRSGGPTGVSEVSCGDPAGDADRGVAGGAAGAVRHRDEASGR